MPCSVAMSMRRPNMLRVNKWINDCLEVVANNPRATKLDKYLVSWVRITKIMEEIGTSLAFDDPSNMANFSEPSVQLKISGFEKALEAWKKSSEQDVNGMALYPLVLQPPCAATSTATYGNRYNHASVPPHSTILTRNCNARRSPTRRLHASLRPRESPFYFT